VTASNSNIWFCPECKLGFVNPESHKNCIGSSVQTFSVDQKQGERRVAIKKIKIDLPVTEQPLIISNVEIKTPNFQSQFESFTNKEISPVSLEVDTLRNKLNTVQSEKLNIKRKLERRDAKIEIYENLLKNVMAENKNYLVEDEKNDIRILADSVQGNSIQEDFQYKLIHISIRSYNETISFKCKQRCNFSRGIP
jgi:hypothetical protein